MIFRPSLAKLIVEGKKTATRRLTNLESPRSPWRSCSPSGPFPSYPVGKTFAVNPGRGLHRVADCEVTGRFTDWLYRVTPEQALAEGFPSRPTFLGAFCSINPGKGIKVIVHVVEFKLTRVEPDAIERLDALLAPG